MQARSHPVAKLSCMPPMLPRMPMRPNRPCSRAGCRNYASPTSSRCPAHARQYEQNRGTSTQRGYDSKWRSLRDAFLALHPMCESCLKEGESTPATDVDHIIAHRGDDSLRLAWDNLQALCHQHHSMKTVAHDGGLGRPRV